MFSTGKPLVSRNGLYVQGQRVPSIQDARAKYNRLAAAHNIEAKGEQLESYTFGRRGRLKAVVGTVAQWIDFHSADGHMQEIREFTNLREFKQALQELRKLTINLRNEEDAGTA